MNNEAPSREFSDWYQNEESFDLTNFVASENLLNIFPSTTPLEVGPKQEKVNYIDTEADGWYDPFYGNSVVAPTSEISSPARVSYTSPVTPRAERKRPRSPHHLQLDGLTTTMSSSRFVSMQPDDAGFIAMQQDSADVQNMANTNVYAVKQESNCDVTMSQSNQLAVKTELYERGNVSKSLSVSSPSTSYYPETMSASELANFQKKNKIPAKGTVEYIEKRRRNNVAVRRSRDKAKQKAQETQKKVDELSSENEKLHRRVAELTHELSTLKKLLQALPHSNS